MSDVAWWWVSGFLSGAGLGWAGGVFVTHERFHRAVNHVNLLEIIESVQRGETP